MRLQTSFRRHLAYAGMFLIAAFPADTVRGQAHFPAAHARWHQHMGYGTYYCYTDGDTVIQGQKARIIRQEARVKPEWANHGLAVEDLRSLAVFTRSDTSFIYNPYFGRFTPLYIFNARQGDSICLPLIDPGGGNAFFGDWGDSTFCFIVDSIKAVLYDQHLLRTYYTRSYKKHNTLELNWGPPESGAYADRLGGLFTGFLPQCVPNTQCLSFGTDSRQPAGYLRCYEDGNYHIRLVAEDCADGGLPKSIRAKPGWRGLAPGPHPVDGHLYWETGDRKVRRLDLLSVNGQRLRQFPEPRAPLFLGDLPFGIYILVFYLDDGSVHRHRVLMRNAP